MRTSVRSAANPSGVETPFSLTIKAGGTVSAESVAVKPTPETSRRGLHGKALSLGKDGVAACPASGQVFTSRDARQKREVPLPRRAAGSKKRGIPPPATPNGDGWAGICSSRALRGPACKRLPPWLSKKTAGVVWLSDVRSCGRMRRKNKIQLLITEQDQEVLRSSVWAMLAGAESRSDHRGGHRVRFREERVGTQRGKSCLWSSPHATRARA